MSTKTASKPLFKTSGSFDITLARRFKGGRRDIIASGNSGSISGADISKKVSGRPPVNDIRTGLAPSAVSSDVKFLP